MRTAHPQDLIISLVTGTPMFRCDLTEEDFGRLHDGDGFEVVAVGSPRWQLIAGDFFGFDASHIE